MEFFGTLERLASELYPYRWFITTGIALAVAAAGVLVQQRGWHRVLWRRRLTVAIVAVPILAIMLPVGYYTLSPLWTRTHLEEESPLALLSASIPEPSPAATSTAEPPMAPVSTPTPEPVTSDSTTVTATGEPTPATESTPTIAFEPTPVEEPTPEPTADAEPVIEPEPEQAEFIPRIVFSGQFQGADDFHFGSGTALLIENAPGQYVFRVEDFSVRNGPDLFVYLSTNPEGWSEDALNLGELKATDGAFNYDIPPGTDISPFRSAIVWCREFAVLFSTATFS